MFSRGVDCLLKKSKLQAEMILSKATHTFKGIIELQSDVRVSCSRTPSDDEASDSDSTDSDTDYDI